MASRTPAVLTNNQNNEQINFLANPFVQCGFLLVFPIFRTKKEDELQPTRTRVTQTQTQMCHNKSCKWRRIGSSLFTRKSCKLKKYFVPLDKSFILQFGEIGMRQTKTSQNWQSHYQYLNVVNKYFKAFQQWQWAHEWVSGTLTLYWTLPHGSHRVELKISSASIHYLIILLSISVSPQLCYKAQSNCRILLISKELKGTFYLWFLQLRPLTLPLLHPIPLQQTLG